MKKILAIIIVLAAAWSIPPVRARVSSGAVPVLDKLGPVGAPVITPARRFAAKGQVTSILRLIASDFNEGKELPEDRYFQHWLKRRSKELDPNDPWGNPLWMQRGRGTLTVGSSGADGKKDTADDVKHTVPF